MQISSGPSFSLQDLLIAQRSLAPEPDPTDLSPDILKQLQKLTALMATTSRQPRRVVA